MKKENKIIFTAQDPGGFNSIFPVIKKLENKRNINFKVLLANESRKIAKDNRINFIDCVKLTDNEIQKILINFNPVLIVMATSTGLSLEKKITLWAKTNKTKTLAIVDFWSNYKLRFSNPETFDLAYIPDKICVIDEYMKNEMLKDNFEEEKLIITGNPFFDTFQKTKKQKGNFILFASQPFSEIFRKNDKRIDTLIFNEVEIFSTIVKLLEELKINLPIIIAFHPRSRKRDKFDNIINNSSLTIEIAKKNTEDLMGEAELIIGINTMVLFQASIIGNKVISYQPGITQDQDPLVSNHLKISYGIYEKESLKKILKNIFSLKKEENNNVNNYLNKNFTDNVIKVIKNFSI